jgi:Tfp pilus assembly protein PilO
MDLPKINLPPIKTKYKIIAALGLAALLCGSYYDHAYKPHARTISALKQDMVSLNDTITIIRNLEYSSAKNDWEILQKIEAKKNNTLSEIIAEESKIPRRADFSKILETITQQAYESGFEIKGIEPKDFTQKEAYQSMSLHMEISARYANLLLFLNQLKTLSICPEYIQINTTERPNLSIQLNLSILAQ